MGTKFGGVAAENVTREFAPEIFKVFQTLHLPLPRVPVPSWWTKDVSVARPSMANPTKRDDTPDKVLSAYAVGRPATWSRG